MRGRKRHRKKYQKRLEAMRRAQVASESLARGFDRVARSIQRVHQLRLARKRPSQ